MYLLFCQSIRSFCCYIALTTTQMWSKIWRWSIFIAHNYAACVYLCVHRPNINSKLEKNENHIQYHIAVLNKCCMLMHQKSFFLLNVRYVTITIDTLNIKIIKFVTRASHWIWINVKLCCNAPKSSNSCRFVLSTLALLLGICKWLLQMKCADPMCL